MPQMVLAVPLYFQGGALQKLTEDKLGLLVGEMLDLQLTLWREGPHDDQAARRRAVVSPPLARDSCDCGTGSLRCWGWLGV